MWYCTSSEPSPRMKMNRKSLFFSTILLLVISVKLQATDIKHMYEASLPVVSQDVDIRKAAFEQALIEVAVRVSGTSLAPTQFNLSDAGRLISQYRYRSLSDFEINTNAEKAPTLVQPKYKLWVQFDENKLKQLLHDNGLPLWGYQRPNVLVWLAVKDGRNRYLLKRADQSQIKNVMEQGAERRGLPIIWPEYNAADQRLIEFTDVWGQFWEPIKQASERYAANAVLLGRMNWSQGSWQVDWSLMQGDKIENWSVNADDLALLTSSGIGIATDSISSRFAVFADSFNDAGLIVRVSNLDNVKKYSQAAHYLASLAPVKNVYAREVNKQQVDFYIDLNGDENDLRRIIALGKVLTVDTRAESIDEVSKTSRNSEHDIMPVVLRYNLGK